MTHIVIIGGGFGGIYTAKELLKHLDQDKDSITLINKTNYFLFTPMLHEIATGGISLQHIAEPIRKIIKNKNFEFLEDEAAEIDINKKIVKRKLGTPVSYDYLVVAAGAGTNFFNIPGAEEYCYTLKDLHQAFDIRNKIIEQLETAEREQSKDHYLTFAVLGAGPTGVELAGEIIEFAQQIKEDCHNIKDRKIMVYLIQRGPKILPMLHDKCIEKTMKELRRKEITVLTNAEVTRVHNDGFEINHKKKIKAGMMIWTSGVRSNKIAIKPDVARERESIVIDAYLRLQGRTKEFAIGDCAVCVDANGNKVPWLAQAAVSQAKICAHNIIADMNNAPLLPFIFKPSGLLVSVGQKFAVAEINGFRFKGFFAWWLWRTIYLSKVLGLDNKIRIAYEWTLNLFFKRDSTKI
ncbi:NAD(P)/FAD-dependent oxidoreductase [Candidatus Woesearchaeota archaeon]|nr:NAD(P)/FAD-dependent oxidoreductase [Candidatus Woesearchaeota archaeon]